MENSGALDAKLVIIADEIDDDGDESERLFVVGVLRQIDDGGGVGTTSGVASKRDVRVGIDGCWTVTLTRGVRITGVAAGGVDGVNDDVGIVVNDDVLVFVNVVGFKLHLIT